MTDFHAHVGVTGWSVEGLHCACKHFVAYEHAMGSFQPPSHQINQSPCLQSTQELFAAVSGARRALDACKALECLVKTAQPGEAEQETSCSYKLNLAKHSSGTSLELHGHHGALGSEAAQHWACLVTNLVKASLDDACSTPPRDSALKEMLNMCLQEEPKSAQALCKNCAQMLNDESEKPGSLCARKAQSLGEIFGQREPGGNRDLGKRYLGKRHLGKRNLGKHNLGKHSLGKQAMAGSKMVQQARWKGFN